VFPSYSIHAVVHACCQAFRWLPSQSHLHCTVGLNWPQQGTVVGRRCLCKGRHIQCKLGNHTHSGWHGVQGFLPRLACCVIALCKTSRQPISLHSTLRLAPSSRTG
jgi:hypothetical protein